MKTLYATLLLFLSCFVVSAQCPTSLLSPPEFTDQAVWKVKSIAGNSHILAIREDGTLWAWGDNSHGQLGIGTTISSVNPVLVSNEKKWKAVSAGPNFSVAIKTDGTLWTWGANESGQLGNARPGTDVLAPARIGEDSTWKSIDAGSRHVIALKTNGTVWGWGYDTNGQVGGTGRIGDWVTYIRESPHQFPEGNKWKRIFAGGTQSYAIDEDNNLYRWGSIWFDGELHSLTGLTWVYSEIPWKTMAVGELHALGIKSDGTLWAWGNNEYNQLGSGTNLSYIDEPAPVVGDATDWIDVAGGESFSVATKNNGTVWVWGTNTGSASLPALSPTPVEMGGAGGWTTVSEANHSIITLQPDGSLFMWGSNYNAVAGDGSTIPIPTPKIVREVDLRHCGNGTLADLASSSEIKWYTAATGGSALASTTALANNTTYYASQVVSGEESCARREVHVLTDSHPPAAPTVVATQEFCIGATVANLEADGTFIQWYDAAEGGTLLPSHTQLVGGRSYFASQRPNACESSRTEVKVVVQDTPPPIASSPQASCGDTPVSSLVADGTMIQWYLSETDSIPVDPDEFLSYSTYYATQTVNHCTSRERAAVDILTVVHILPQAQSLQSFCNHAVVSDLIVHGSEVKWYADETGGESLASSAVLMNDSSYYATSTKLGCETPARTKVTVRIPRVDPPRADSVQQVCEGSQVMRLTAYGEFIQWYRTPEGGAAVNKTAALEEGLYYASAFHFSSGCTSDGRSKVRVAYLHPATPAILEPEQKHCKYTSSSMLRADFAPVLNSVAWYRVNNGVPEFAGALEQDGQYVVKQMIDGCWSELSDPVTVTVVPYPVLHLSGDSIQYMYEGQTINDIEVTGDTTGIYWVEHWDSATRLSRSTPVKDRTAYWALKSNEMCTSFGYRVTIRLLEPTIVSFSPASAAPGDTIVLRGEDLQAFRKDFVVDFNGVPGAVIEGTDSTLFIIVPEGATSGVISISFNGRVSTSNNAFTILTVAGNEDEFANAINVVPNPASTRISVTFDDRHHITMIRLRDSHGRELKRLTPGLSNSAEIEISDLTPGLYLLHISGDKKMGVRKFVKE